MDFIETMAQYLDGYRQDVWDVAGHKKKLDRIEAKYPGFTERYNNFGDDVDGYRETGDDELLVQLLHEGFVIDGIFEEDMIEQMKEKWTSAASQAREFDIKHIGLTKKEE